MLYNSQACYHTKFNLPLLICHNLPIRYPFKFYLAQSPSEHGQPCDKLAKTGQVWTWMTWSWTIMTLDEMGLDNYDPRWKCFGQLWPRTKLAWTILTLDKIDLDDYDPGQNWPGRLWPWMKVAWTNMAWMSKGGWVASGWDVRDPIAHICDIPTKDFSNVGDIYPEGKWLFLSNFLWADIVALDSPRNSAFLWPGFLYHFCFSC